MVDMTGLHVLIVPAWWPSPEQPISGIFCTDYARAFAAARAKVGVIYPDLVSARYLGRGTEIPWAPRLLHEDLDGVPVIRVRGLHTALRMPALQMHRFRRWLRWGLRVYRSRYGEPDVLHAMCAIPAGWACSHLNDPLARRVVLTEHTGSFSGLLRPLAGGSYVRAGLLKAAAVVAVSAHLRETMRTACDSREIDVVANPVVGAFTASAPPAVETDDAGRPVYRAVFVGRVTEAKGVLELADAAVALSSDDHFSVEWHVAGYGPAEGELQRRMIAAGLVTSLKMHGFREKGDIATLIRQSHFLILPSHAENCPLAICEALSIGRPVVTTEAVGCKALVGQADGVLARIGDASSLSDAVVRLVSIYSQWDWHSISDRARNRFSGSAISSQYAGIFHKVVG